ncbi:hypothetical protein CRG98_006500 [Punica granatum]|uniref:Uncharacterized protein n=1 Tax=Punica granatum TaxID=22663 RepID=A0A2I0KX91_PUNGR|nr:hypothetical protein CRG98_006500 [Punica granatum]
MVTTSIGGGGGEERRRRSVGGGEWEKGWRHPAGHPPLIGGYWHSQNPLATSVEGG